LCPYRCAARGRDCPFDPARVIKILADGGRIRDIFIVGHVLGWHGAVKSMASDNDKRNFALRQGDGEESSVFSGGTPRQAALKAARRLTPAGSEDDADPEELRLREKGTHKIHIYEGWAWEEEAPDDSPDWMPGEITKGNVSKQGVEHLDEI
jgi:hypothetical protein